MGSLDKDAAGQKPLCRIVTPVGMLGYGFDETVVERGLALSLTDDIPTAIILDAGSTDGGPSRLALGKMASPKRTYERDLKYLVHAVQTYHVPLLIGSAGGDGSDIHVKQVLEMIREIVEEQGNE